MVARTDEFRRHLNDFWDQAVEQWTDVRDALSERMGSDWGRLRRDGDVLFRRLGEELAPEGDTRKSMSRWVKKTLNRLNTALEDALRPRDGFEPHAAPGEHSVSADPEVWSAPKVREPGPPDSISSLKTVEPPKERATKTVAKSKRPASKKKVTRKTKTGTSKAAKVRRASKKTKTTKKKTTKKTVAKKAPRRRRKTPSA